MPKTNGGASRPIIQNLVDALVKIDQIYTMEEIKCFGQF
jgi:hypothetical protein